MVLPDVPATIFEGEAEMALVIGKRATNVKAADAMELHLRLHQFHRRLGARPAAAGNVFFQMKSRDTFAPIGPYLVTADEIADPQKLQVKLWVNGELKQNFNTDDMAHKIPRCIEWVTLDPHARARRHPRHRHQPSRPAMRSRTATRSSWKSKGSAG